MLSTFTLPLLAVLWSFLQLLPGSVASTPPEQPAAASSAPVSLSADTRSLEFVENKGQWDKRAQYAADIPTGKLFLQPTSFLYVLHDPAALQKGHLQDSRKPAPLSAAPEKLTGHAYSVTFLGANPNPAISAQEATEGIRNYYLGNDPAKWGSGAKGYRQVQYQDLYPGINMKLYEQEGKLKYDLLVSPGASPTSIQLRYSGANRVQLQNGKLKIETSVGYVTEHAPVAYQWKNEQRQVVPCEYTLEGQTLRFRFPKGYDKSRALLIDPIVEFSSFTGSTADNWGFTATYDNEGNMYSGGIVHSTGYPVSEGAFQVNYQGQWDIGIIKYNTKVSGTAARLYATYLGGQDTECPHSLVVNAADELLILATTGSSDYPISDQAFQRQFNGGVTIAPLGSGGNPMYSHGSDLAITRLKSDGTALVASTFLGGSDNDGLMLSYNILDNITNSLVQNYGDQHRGDIITDPEGNVYIATNTSSEDFPMRNGLSSGFRGGYTDAVICKLSPDLSTLLWGSFYGGTSTDAAYSIQLDQDRNVYVAGGTTSSDLPFTQNGLQPTFSGVADGFILKINASGNTVEAATYLGTNAYDQTYFVQLDEAANVYVLGQTGGINYPVTPGVYSVPLGKQFIHKLNNQLNTTVFSTVFGSTNPQMFGYGINISPTAFLVDDCERLYVAGWGGSTNNLSYDNATTYGLPTTPDAVQTTTDGKDFYLLQLSAGAHELLYATFYGGVQNGSTSGEHVDGGTSRFDKKGFVYQAVCGGCGGSSNFPVPPGAHSFSSINRNSNCNNAAFKFNFEVPDAGAGPDRTVCVNEGPVQLNGSPAGGVWSGRGVTLQNGQYYFTPAASLIGANVLTYTVPNSGSCSRSSTRTFTVTSEAALSVTGLASAYCVNNGLVTLTGSSPTGTFVLDGVTLGVGGNISFTPGTLAPGEHTLIYRTDSGCQLPYTQTFTINALPVVSAGPDTLLCPGSTTPFRLRGTPEGGVWSGRYVSADGVFSPPANFSGAVTVLYTVNGNCSASAFRTISVAAPPFFNASITNQICANYPTISGYAPFTATFSNSTSNANSFIWDFGDGSQSTENVPQHVYTQPGTYTIWLTATYGNGCTERVEVGQVIVEKNFIPNIITPNGDGLNETFVQRFSCLPTELRIYNRWGKQVHQVEVYQQNWDGGGLSEGTYFYLLKDTAGNTAKGWLEIIR